MQNLNKKGGISILGILFLGVIILLILSYFNISVKDVVESDAGQENFGYVAGETRSVWDKYLKEPAHYLWQDVWIEIFWQGFINNMERIRDGLPTDFDKASENLEVRQYQ